MADMVIFESEPKGGGEHRFYMRKADPGDMVEYLARKFSDEYETQAVVGDDEAFAQIRKTGRLRALLGLRQNVTIRVHVSDAGTLVEVGKAAWADKAVALSVGWVFSLGLPFLTAPWGIYSQRQAVKRAWTLVEYRMVNQPSL